MEIFGSRSALVHRCSARVAIAGLFFTLAGAAQAALVNYQNFNDLSAFSLNGITGVINTGGQGVIGPNPGDGRVLRLTNNVGQAGSAFLTSPFSLASDASFSSYFEFQFTNPINTGADGILFTVQTVSNVAGGGGGGIGYQGLSPSIGVEFDNWDNGAGDGSNGNHAGIDVNGNVSSVVRADTLPAQLDSGTIFHAWVDYKGATDILEVRVALTDTRPSAALMTYNTDLVALLGTCAASVAIAGRFPTSSATPASSRLTRRFTFVCCARRG